MDEFRKDLDDYFCRFTFGQFVTLILLEIVTLFFVFYLGARYGGDLLGTGEPKKEAVIPTQNPKNVDDIVGAPPVDYTYPEVLTSRDGEKGIRIKPSGMTAEEYERQKMENPAAIIERDTPKEAYPEVKTTPKNAAPVSTPSAKVPERPKSAPVVKPAAPLKAAAPAEKTVAREEIPQELTARKPRGKFTVQVGSYQSRAEAASSLRHWKRKGYSAYTSIGNIPQKGTWYRVRIGGFPTRAAAQKFLRRLKATEKVAALVVRSSS